jgi:hypothetical protein
MRVLILLAAALIGQSQALAAGPQDRGRHFYMIGHAGEQYCRDLKKVFGFDYWLKEGFSYDPYSPAEAKLVDTGVELLLKEFRKTGPASTCQYLFDQYGPGSKFQVFEAR